MLFGWRGWGEVNPRRAVSSRKRTAAAAAVGVGPERARWEVGTTFRDCITNNNTIIVCILYIFTTVGANRHSLPAGLREFVATEPESGNRVHGCTGRIKLPAALKRVGSFYYVVARVKNEDKAYTHRVALTPYGNISYSSPMYDFLGSFRRISN